MDYIDIIEKSIYNIDSKICGIIDDYKVLQDSQKVADYVIQFLRTYLEHIAARIYAHENPNKQVPIRGKDKWYTQYMKPLKENNEYGYMEFTSFTTDYDISLCTCRGWGYSFNGWLFISIISVKRSDERKVWISSDE